MPVISNMGTIAGENQKKILSHLKINNETKKGWKYCAGQVTPVRRVTEPTLQVKDPSIELGRKPKKGVKTWEGRLDVSYEVKLWWPWD